MNSIKKICSETRKIGQNSGCCVKVYRHPNGHLSAEYMINVYDEIVWIDGAELIAVFDAPATMAEIRDRIK